MEKPKATPKDFFLWAGAMIALYGSVFALISLFFDYITYAFPDPLNTYYGYSPYQAEMSFEIATLIVLFPTFLILMRIIRKDIAADRSRRDIWVRHWALFLTLFVAGATIVGDLIALLYTFLSGGDLTVSFLLKVLVVLLVAGAGFLHFLADWRGYWVEYPNKAKQVGYAVAVLILASIVAGFLIIGTPWEARQYRLDQEKIMHLQSLQWQIVSYWQQKQTLPESLSELTDPISGSYVPVDPETGQMYGYRATGPLSFELCAEFSTANQGGRPDRMITAVPLEPKTQVHVGGDTWDHEAQPTCFERTIDPDRYPPFNK